MITLLGIKNKQKPMEIGIADVKSFLRDRENLLWVDIEKPTKEDFQTIQDIFDFHPLCIETCKRFSQMPKVDDYGDYIFLVMHRISFDKKTGTIGLNELDMFLGKNYLVTIHMFESDVIHELREKIDTHTHLSSEGIDFLMYTIINDVIDKYFPVVDALDDLIDELEGLVIKNKAGHRIAYRAIRIRRNIAELKKITGPQREVIGRLARHENKLISERTAIYFRDVYDNIIRIYSMLETHRDLIASTFEAYLSLTNNRMNQVMKQLTLIATIFLPLTFITGIYGMNFQSMPELASPLGYPAALSLMLIIGLGFYVYFRRKGWV